MEKITTSKTFAFFATLIIMLAVTMTLFSPIPNNVKLIIRILFIVVFFISWIQFKKRDLTNAKDIAFAFLALNLAFLIVSFFTPAFWNLNQETSKGLALIKLSDAVIISLVLILSFVIGGYKLKGIYLTKGRLIPGLIIGILFFIVLGYLAIFKNYITLIPCVFITQYGHQTFFIMI